MALQIATACINCWACQPVCPTGAITYDATTKPNFRIHPAQCTECVGDYDDPQCASLCPVEGALLTATGEPYNPPGSLSGIPPVKLALAQTGGQWRLATPAPRANLT